MALNPRDRDWQTLAVQASKEMDGAKLTIIVALLCSALDERLKPPASTAAVKLQLPVNPVILQPNAVSNVMMTVATKGRWYGPVKKEYDLYRQ